MRNTLLRCIYLIFFYFSERKLLTYFMSVKFYPFILINTLLKLLTFIVRDSLARFVPLKTLETDIVTNYRVSALQECQIQHWPWGPNHELCHGQLWFTHWGLLFYFYSFFFLKYIYGSQRSFIIETRERDLQENARPQNATG